MKSLNKISLIFAIIFVVGFSIFLAQKTSAAPILTCDSAHCNLCIEMDNCESSGCIWRPALNRCVQPVESTPVPTDYNPPAGFCPGFSAKYSSDGTLAEIRTSCFGTGKAYHNVDLYAPNSSPYYLTLNPEQTCYSPDIPTFNEIENCNNLPLSWGDTSNSVIAQLFSKFLSKVKILLGNTAEALPYGHCYAPQEVCTNFYPWQIYHAEVFTTYISDPEDCQMEIQLRNKANQNISNSYYGSIGKMGCGPASNTQGIGGLTVSNDDASAAKFWQHVSLDGSMFDAVQWEGYVKYWAKRVSFRNFDIQARTINKGDSVTVSWNVLNATKVFLFIGESACKSIHIPEKPIDPKCVLDHANTLRLSNSGSVYLYPSETTNFYLYAYGPSGEGSQFILNGPIKVTVTEVIPTPTPTSDIKANGKDGPISIASGSSVDLSWTSSNLGANPSCTASNAWSGAKATSGSESTGALTSAKTYTLTCSGSNGSASDSVKINMAGAGQGTIVVRARLDGEAWTGNIGYTLSGPETITGTAVRKQHSNVTAGSYTLTLISGGPSNAILDNISPAPSLSLSGGGTIIFTLNFKTASGPTHKECNASKRCVVIVGEGSDTCTDDVSCGWTGDTHKECNVSKRCVAIVGEGSDTCTDDVSCG
ncbi:MAG: hypothetical protein PHC43_06095, partial [Candidatus Marinimicrobia bacterium]|nr:hypothetical protein [Candidatus Neomarinimicrobiota bacterium]